MRREGLMAYFWPDPDRTSFDSLSGALEQAADIRGRIVIRGGE